MPITYSVESAALSCKPTRMGWRSHIALPSPMLYGIRLELAECLAPRSLVSPGGNDGAGNQGVIRHSTLLAQERRFPRQADRARVSVGRGCNSSPFP